jgi:glyoxylase I family protein
VRTIFLGDRSQPDAGVIELLDLGTGSVGDEPVGSGLPRRGAFLVSLVVPVEATLARLAELGLGGTPRRMPAGGGGQAATVVDPDGIVVELLDHAVSLG